MPVILPAWNNVPVKVWNNITEAGQIDLVGTVICSNRRFCRKYDAHQSHLVFDREVGHFTSMLAENHPTKPRVIGICDTYNAAKLVFPERFTAWRLAKFAAASRLAEISAELFNFGQSMSIISIHAAMLCGGHSKKEGNMSQK